MRISVIIPTLNEEKSITNAIKSIQNQDPNPHDVIVVDGGSTDSTTKIVAQFPNVRIFQTASIISLQNNFGAQKAIGDVLLFFHADCELETGGLNEMTERLRNPRVVGGAFRYALQQETNILDKILVVSGSWNARFSGMYLGDHGIFCRKDIFLRTGGFPEIAIMYEFDFMKRLHKEGKVIQLEKRCYSSSRKFKQHGYLKIMFLMRALRISHYLGLPNSRLKRLYQNLSLSRTDVY
jgi:rSAM/selenodomain-associated transferase 2